MIDRTRGGRAAVPTVSSVRMRLIRSDDRPASNASDDVLVFGLQDTKGEIMPGTPGPDGSLTFDFDLRVKEGPDGRPTFMGAFASGPADDRFVYLAWRSPTSGAFVNRVKRDWPPRLGFDPQSAVFGPAPHGGHDGVASG